MFFICRSTLESAIKMAAGVDESQGVNSSAMFEDPLIGLVGAGCFQDVNHTDENVTFPQERKDVQPARALLTEVFTGGERP